MAPRLSILIPLYNEEDCLIGNVFLLMRFLAEREIPAEILLGSNGSTDATVAIGRVLEAACPESIRFFHFEARGVVGEVFRRAVVMAQSPCLISLDMDLSVDLEFIPRAMALLEECDIVVGSKQSGTQSRSLWRRTGSGLFILCAQKLLKLPYDDYSLAAKGYRIAAVQGIQPLSSDTNYVLDLIYRCHHSGRRIAVLPVACNDWRRSRFRLLEEACIRFAHLFALVFKEGLPGSFSPPSS